MIIKQEKRAIVESFGIDSTTQMGIDESDKGILMMILSEGLYSDPIGSLVRESCSNALDANREGGSAEPIIVSLRADNGNNWSFKVTDYGTGISPDVMENVISKYAASTKRDREDQLGYFGLGFKAPLAYTDAFYIYTNWNGTHYKYMMRKGEEGSSIDLLHTEDTNEPNGTTIHVPLKSHYDRSEFIDSISEQLAYFEGVYFDISGFDNSYKIIKHDDWKHSPMVSGGEMHICLDNVYYPIDWAKLGIPKINFNIGLNFKVSEGITPTPSRESIIYNPEVKELIINKIGKVAEYFVTAYNEELVAAENFMDIYPKLDYSYSPFITIEGVNFHVNHIKSYTNIEVKQPTLQGVELLDLKRIHEKAYCLIPFYFTSLAFDSSRITSKLKGGDENIFQNIYNRKRLIHIPEEKITAVKKDYIKDTQGRGFIVKKKPHFKRVLKSNSEQCYFTLLKLYKYEKKDWRKVINEFITLENAIIDKYILDGSSIVPTEEWLEERKSSYKRREAVKIEEQEINPKWAVAAERGDVICLFKQNGITKLDKVDEVNGGTVIYATEEEKDRLYDLYQLNRYSQHFKIAILVNRDIKRVEKSGSDKWLSLSEFMKGNYEHFGKYCTAFLVKKFLDSARFISNNVEFIEKIDKDYAQKIKSLRKYGELTFSYRSVPEIEIMKDMLAICMKDNLWDTEMYKTLNEVKKGCRIWTFLTGLNCDKYSQQVKNESLKLAKEVYASRKKQMKK